MAFEGLSDKLQAAFKKLTGKGKLNEAEYQGRHARSAHGVAGSRRQLCGRKGFY